MTRQAISTKEYQPATLALCVIAPYHRNLDSTSYCDEFFNLIKTNRLKATITSQIRLRTIDSTFFLTKGKLLDIKELCRVNNIEELIISEPLTARQERNLEDILQCRVFDRTQLILEIFEKAATTLEGKTQVAIAMLKHKKSRLAKKGLHLAQQAGHIGMRGGPGETSKEKEARHIEESILKLKRQLDKFHQSRQTQRKKRITSQVPYFALIGYTNAGKSSLLNALTKSNVLAEDKLFATLETTTRELYINGIKKGVLSDTVGFIQNIPHHLIAAFKSTLSELEDADLLLHVIDLSNPNWREQIHVVDTIINELGINSPILYVFNKKDAVDNVSPLLLELDLYHPHVLISTLSKEGMQPLINFLAIWSNKTK